MKIDHHFPPPPQFNQPPLRCDDIPPARQRALNRLSDFAAVAESLVGTLNIEHPESSVEFPATARGFCLFALRSSPFADEVAELLSRKRISLASEDHVDADHVMIIDPRRYWGVLGPIRGDVVLFADGHAAIVTKPLCMGCQHFEGVSLVSSDGPLPAGATALQAGPQIAKLTHWTSTVRWIVRLIDESEEPRAKGEGLEPSSGQPGQDSQEVAPPANEEPSITNEASAKRKRKLTGV